MKNILLLVIAISLTSCKNNKKESIDYSKENLEITTSIYPENISKVFEAHGGVENWNKMQSLTFTIPNPNGGEVTTTDLKYRKSLIDMPNHILGFNGKDIWLKDKDTTQYKGNPKFYYNLMFYFYAMPFVLADDGIIYEEAEPLVFEDKSYPGIKIAYESGIGESPDDEYILYYDPDTYQMSWLAYTVTYFSKEKSKDFRFIQYGNWQEVDGLLLPETISWYNVENNLPTTLRNNVQFTNIKLSKEKPDATRFEVPENARIIK
ncbi:DUF6503 family protein [Tamlana sp. 2201CG12-4]|uniref:DUF6503 family protein n=1 Tax=Tamlana sp. 2201CG12-4 TaxID=3112582 RepID=UPI002DB94D9C|nr:DUF6503 family protein [Tamlana sp. 2201CG12-4]MEC3908403.1 DUF6503 family protein [Tamlana sp. 2201CG12-4]